MNQRKPLKNAYIDFSNGVKENSKSTNLFGNSENKSWGKIIHLYYTLKYTENEYLDFRDYKVDTRKIITGNVLQY